MAVAMAVISIPALGHAQPAKAPTPDELKAARELFQSAYKDEQEKHFAEALDKFQRVAAVKESGSVRYRIGAVLESLGRLREARDAFRALAATKSALPAPEQEIADSAAERAHQLDKKIPRISIKLQDNPPPDARVTIDGAAVPVSTTPRSIELDPGDHLVQATSPTTSPSSSRFVLGEGGEVDVTVVLTPERFATKPAPARERVEPPPSEPPRPHRNKTLAVVALAAGGVLLVTGIVLLAVRASDISDLNEQCREGVCPAGKRSTLQSEHDQASTFGPLGVGVGLVGLAGLGLGGYLVLRPPPAATPASGTTTSSPATGLRIGPRAVRGGAVVGLTTAF